jgi:hypothetical protein
MYVIHENPLVAMALYPNPGHVMFCDLCVEIHTAPGTYPSTAHRVSVHGVPNHSLGRALSSPTKTSGRPSLEQHNTAVVLAPRFRSAISE